MEHTMKNAEIISRLESIIAELKLEESNKTTTHEVIDFPVKKMRKRSRPQENEAERIARMKDHQTSESHDGMQYILEPDPFDQQ